MKPIRWSKPAQDDLAALDRFYRPLDPEAATRMAEAAVAAAGFLQRHPEAGQLVSDRGHRKWRVAATPYVLLYRVGETLRILRVVHHGRDWQRFI